MQRPTLRSALLLLGIPLLLAPRGCAEPGDPGSCFCPEIYAPVCGADGNTYGNACEAECADVRVVHEGTCEAGCVCPAVYAPVCGEDGRTYGNSCEAACAGVMAVCEGPCETSCVCPDVHAPVCGTDGRTYGNSCEANCAGVMVVAEGPCECPAVPPIYCEWGYVVDQRGCPTPTCLPPPECPPVLCDVYCEHGHVLDERGCATCACNPSPAPICIADDECGAGERCDFSVCRSPCEGAPEDIACPAVCYGECRPEAPRGCATDRDCGDGAFCAIPPDCSWGGERDGRPMCVGVCLERG